MPTTPATPVVHQVNLLLLLLQEQGDLASMVLETRSHRTPRETHRSLANPNQTPKWKSTSCAFAFHTTTTTPNVATGRNDDTTKPTVYYTDDNGTPATWTLGLVFQQVIDRQDRILQTEGRFSLLEPQHWRHHYSLVYRNTPPDKDSSHRRHAL